SAQAPPSALAAGLASGAGAQARQRAPARVRRPAASPAPLPAARCGRPAPPCARTARSPAPGPRARRAPPTTATRPGRPSSPSPLHVPCALGAIIGQVGGGADQGSALRIYGGGGEHGSA